ncbi:Neuronal acetylcholine receptor subunit alpha-10 [Armadillidium nasatum]|uniref:Neuronal acetylcholine receptor subunit alpha-10 n=1 Tax=Armadillidium nasatum TaxID=96803 RepID=A0A5N5SIX3_9CRUS|nr:Neuronal acetylcholine receptor subunit alpha-10 [Armadillidium nasatum]
MDADIALFNSAHSDKSTPTSDLPVLCNYDGNILWVPPFTAEVPCEMDLLLWPSDTHTCVLKFGSWAHHGDQIDLQVEEDKAISLEFLEKNKRWSILNYTAVKEFTEYKDESYMHIDFKFTIKREAGSHAAYVTQTVFGVMIIVMASYVLPLNFHLSKFLLHLFSILILIICNFVLFATLPSTGGSIPHAVKYYFGSIILTTLSLLCHIIMASTMAPSHSVSVRLPKRVTKVLKMETPSFEFERQGVPYSTLEEESIGTTAEFEEESNRSQEAKKQRDKKTTITLYRLVNAVLFSVFFIAYLIDYTIMKKIIDS